MTTFEYQKYKSVTCFQLSEDVKIDRHYFWDKFPKYYDFVSHFHLFSVTMQPLLYGLNFICYKVRDRGCLQPAAQGKHRSVGSIPPSTWDVGVEVPEIKAKFEATWDKGHEVLKNVKEYYVFTFSF